MVTIPRAEINAIGSKYDRNWRLDVDLGIDAVRRKAADFRLSAEYVDDNVAEQNEYRGMADDLDALADRYEREGAT